jgi:hypothetical protein
MAIGSGLAGSVGIGAETPGAYGTVATFSRFHEVTKASLKEVPNFVQGGGLAAGRMLQAGSRRVKTSTSVEGSLEMEVATKGMGLLLAHLTGSAGAPVQQAATTAYLQSRAFVDNIGKSLSVQTGIPDRNGTVRPYTALGCKVTQAEFSCATNELLTVTYSLDGQQLVETEALSAPSYSTGVKPFHSGQMSVKTGVYGSETAISGVKGVTCTIERPQQTDAFYAGATTPGTKAEPVMNDWVKISGTLDTDFVDKTQLADLFASNTPTALVLEWVGATIASTYKQTFRIKIPMVFFDEGTPTLEGPEVTGLSVPFTAQYDETNAPVTIDYISTDTTA